MRVTYRTDTRICRFLLTLLLCIGTLRPIPTEAAVTYSVNVQDPTQSNALSLTGTAPFDASSGAGNDTAAHDHVIRTGDTITYEVDYSTSGGASTDLTITSTAPKNGATLYADWQSMSTNCIGASAISADGQSISCHLGAIPSGSNGILPFVLKVRGDVPNGTQLTPPTFTIADPTASSPPTPVATTGYVESNLTAAAQNYDTVSATPIADLDASQSYFKYTTSGPGGVNGYYLTTAFTIHQLNTNGKGTAGFSDPITFTVNSPIDSGGATIPNVSLYGSGATACGVYGANNGATGTGVGLAVLYGALNVWGGSTATNSVINSGTITCSQPGGIGTPVTVTISGEDASGRWYPTQNLWGQSLPVTERDIVSGYINWFLPASVIEGSPYNGTISAVKSVFGNFSPTSNANQTNAAEPTANNAPNYGGFVTTSMYGLTRFEQTTSTFLPPYGPNSYIAGSGLVGPAQEFVIYAVNENYGITTLTNPMLCIKIDPTRVQPINFDSTTNIVNWYTSVASGGAFISGPTTTVEFGTTPLGTTGAYGSGQQTATCAESGPWYSSIAAVPSGTPITKIRAFLSSLTPGQAYTVLVAIKTLGNSVNPVGSTLTTWFHNTSDQTTQPDYNAVGSNYDTVTIIGALARTTISVTNGSTINAGSNIAYSIASTLTSSSTATLSNVTLTDTLPSGVSYVAGSASLTPTSVTVNGDGTTTLIWNLGNTPGNLPTVTFSGLIAGTVVNGSVLTNTAVVSDSDDSTAATYRTSTVSTTVQNTASFTISASTTTPNLNPSATIPYLFSYANLSASPASGYDAIALLPTNGSNGTTFHGSIAYATISGSNGENMLFTSRNAALIDTDPGCQSNGGSVTSGCAQLANSTTWCTQANFGTTGCPANAAAVTAVRIQEATSIPGPSNTHTVTLNVSPIGNTPGDVYRAAYTARVDGLSNPLTSNTVEIDVTQPQLSLLLSCISPANCQTSTTQAEGTLESYQLVFTNTSQIAESSIVLTTHIPYGATLQVGSVGFTPGTSGLGATISYSTTASAPYVYGYTPVSGGCGAPSGFDHCVTSIMWTLSGSLSPTTPNNTGTLTFSIRI